MYLTQVTKTSQYGYEVNDLNDRRDSLVESNQALEVEAARLQALERIRSSEVARQLQDPSNVDYLEF